MTLIGRANGMSAINRRCTKPKHQLVAENSLHHHHHHHHP
jgi:hypothetical protein